uniref:Odorant binding protein 99b n=1 Tax=Anastrepha ludens TaxID=28586 RepID=A0A9E8DAH5_9MUSC|nr:odorant binding protein 99b [Anastrepha ludens]
MRLFATTVASFALLHTLQRIMKFFIIAFLSLIALVLADHDHDHAGHSDYVVKTNEDLVEARKQCVSKLSIPDDLVEKYRKWEYPDDEKSRCFLKCIFEQFGLYDDEKGFDIHKIHHQLEGDKVDHSGDVHAKIENCAKEGADAADACTRAYRGITCFFKNNLSLVKQSVGSA